MKHNPLYPLRHLSIRVPWHDNAWSGTICNRPMNNGACLALKNCAQNRNDELEVSLAGESIKNITESQYPPCVGERATFMAPFSFIKTLSHPYVESSPGTHGHLEDTPVTFPSFAAAAVPYNWMLKQNADRFAEYYDLDYDSEREPVLDWKTENYNAVDRWIQQVHNQKAMLNCFFEHLEEQTSLVFFYAKQVPFVEAGGRILIGVGKINKIIESDKYLGSNKKFGAAYWEHMILHSIRQDNKNGFLLPYHEAVAFAEKNNEFDPSVLAVIAPPDKQLEFSFAAEHVATGTAIRVLLSCLKSWEKAKELGIGRHHNVAIRWIHDELAKLDKLNGYYPGMGSALCALGIEKGHFVAAEIINGMKNDKENPWILFETAIEHPSGILSSDVHSTIPTLTKKWYQRQLAKDKSIRLALLHLLSRFDLGIEQAKSLFVQEEREAAGVFLKDEEILQNPYLIYEALRITVRPTAVNTIDMGLYIKDAPEDLLPNNLFLNDPFDLARIRAITIHHLEQAALSGHTLLPRKELIKQIRSMPISPECEINGDYYEMAEEAFGNAIISTETKNEERAYQLDRFDTYKTIIKEQVDGRINGKRLTIVAEWRELIDEALKQFTTKEADEQELKARREKAAALQEIAESRFSVLIGPAGTGKTTLLTVLSGQTEVESKGVLLLAPTGKARVRMEEVAKDLNLTALTLAQFLKDYGRYNGDVKRYMLSEQYCEGVYETVILDEASMLTEEMLATTIHCLKGVKRFILVGDHRQLPPIGAGRPFVDIIKHLKPSGTESSFPRIGKGYAELTIKRRQGGSKREDLQLAEWFGGECLEPGADSIFEFVHFNRNTQYLRLINWENEKDFTSKFEQVLVEELGLDSITDVKTFNEKLGSEDGRYFNSTKDAEYFEIEPSVNKVETWQILSPIKEKPFGVKALNRKIHQLFRKDKIEYAYKGRNRKIPKPLGIEQIVYGDKVINLGNHSRKNVYPKDNALAYLANGEIGIVTGQFKRSYHTFGGQPKIVEIEFASQKGFIYSFGGGDFKEEGDPPLELAYALTVHKSQGSEFGSVFLIVPNPCFLLTREMLYTALTRQKEKVIVLYQGSFLDIKELSSPLRSDTLKRITNLFKKPDLLDIEGIYLEKNLIHQASDGKMLRSKSELLIYQRLIDKKIGVLYEKKLSIKEVEKLPDFTIEDDISGEIYYWEHCGMMHDTDYVERWEEKYKWYRENEIIPYKEGGGKNGILIITEDRPTKLEDGSLRGAFSVKDIDEVIKNVFNK